MPMNRNGYIVSTVSLGKMNDGSPKVPMSVPGPLPSLAESRIWPLTTVCARFE